MTVFIIVFLVFASSKLLYKFCQPKTNRKQFSEFNKQLSLKKPGKQDIRQSANTNSYSNPNSEGQRRDEKGAGQNESAHRKGQKDRASHGMEIFRKAWAEKITNKNSVMTKEKYELHTN